MHNDDYSEESIQGNIDSEALHVHRLRRRVALGWNEGLEGVQLQIAGDTTRVIHVLAGPGTGKTFALMRRVARLLEEGVSSHKILAVTFTRTAARDLREQLEKLGVEGAGNVRATTLHALSFSILSSEAAFQLTARVPRPLLEFELDYLVDDLAREFTGKRRVRSLVEAYEAGFARLQHETPGAPMSEEDTRFRAALIDWLRFHRSILVGELVPHTLDFVRKNPSAQILPSFEHVLVDEYQDLNKADQALVVELAGKNKLLVIGDDNQSIYGFRYANPVGIQVFPSEHTDTISYQITNCRRCPPNLVEASNALIANNPHRSRNTPLNPDWSRSEASIYLVQHDTPEEEAEAIAGFISAYLTRNQDVKPGEVLVLATRRFFGHKIRTALIQHRLNALSYFFEDELGSVSAAEGFCLLILLSRPGDRAALRAWLGLGKRGDGYAAAYARLRKYAQKHEMEVGMVLEEIASRRVSIPHTGGIVQRYEALKQRLAELDGLDMLNLVRKLWKPDDEESQDVRQLAENLTNKNADAASLHDALLREITQPELPGSGEGIIRVMSLHKSKGLTAKLVVIAGCVMGALPTINPNMPEPQKDAAMEEQRRLFYVAITRASETLVISSAKLMEKRQALANGIQVVRFLGEKVQTAMSPFVAELGQRAPNVIKTKKWKEQVGF